MCVCLCVCMCDKLDLHSVSNDTETLFIHLSNVLIYKDFYGYYFLFISFPSHLLVRMWQ